MEQEKQTKREAKSSLEKSAIDFTNEAKDFQAIIGNIKELLIRGSSGNNRSCSRETISQ